jgi:hypothetical protein
LSNINATTSAQQNSTLDNLSNNMTNLTISSQSAQGFNSMDSNADSISNAQSVYETGVMALPSMVKSFIIFIPDEAHHPPADQKTISPKNPNYVPSTLEIADGSEIAFIHDDPSHIHVGIIKDKDGNLVWTTIPVKFPGGSDAKSLSSSGSPYTISDKQYTPPMEGKIIVNPEKSTGSLTVGTFLCSTQKLQDCKGQFSKAGFRILSEHNFVTKSVQKDISGSNTLLIYSSTLPVKDALVSLGPIIKSLPYK